MLKKIYGPAILFFYLFTSSCTYTFYKTSCDYPVSGQVSKVSRLSDTIHETSGLETAGDHFMSFNDSGGEPAVYFFNDHTILHKTIIGNAFNVDWEDIATDGQFYYIADIGNNFGARDTLTIYKISADKLKTSIHVQDAEKITFSYNEETSHALNGMYSHDSEALIAYNDSLYLFTKNWVSMSTQVYVLPATPGHYHIKSFYSYPVNALITAADIDHKNKEVVLAGYRRGYPILIRYQFDQNPGIIYCGGKARKYYKLFGTQVEGACYGNDGLIYFTSEKRVRKQALYRAD